jgi:hypothetical protein
MAPRFLGVFVISLASLASWRFNCIIPTSRDRIAGNCAEIVEKMGGCLEANDQGRKNADQTELKARRSEAATILNWPIKASRRSE